MIKELKVNYRDKEIEIDKVNYLNIITGQSGVGKTTVLELIETHLVQNKINDAKYITKHIDSFNVENLVLMDMPDDVMSIIKRLFPNVIDIKCESVQMMVSSMWARTYKKIFVIIDSWGEEVKIPLIDMGRTFIETVKFIIFLYDSTNDPNRVLFIDNFRCMKRSFANHLIDFIRKICLERKCHIFMICDSDESLRTLVWGSNYGNTEKYSFVSLQRVERFKSEILVHTTEGYKALQTVQIGLGQY